ncbi:hypothetical protein QFZ33_002610 [Arthrobacter globiformis]|nr:hypothetical protein [Arthrobacter globiformis]
MVVTVFSLSVSTYIVAPPRIRKHRSSAGNTLDAVRSRNGITIRNPENASHATNGMVFTPSTRGPSPKSYCSHIPGSVIHGRWTHTCPSRHAALTWAMARRGGPLRPLVAQAQELFVGFVGADPSLGRLDPYLDLGQEHVRDPGPGTATNWRAAATWPASAAPSKSRSRSGAQQPPPTSRRGSPCTSPSNTTSPKVGSQQIAVCPSR